jgi:hypothetical protein
MAFKTLVLFLFCVHMVEHWQQHKIMHILHSLMAHITSDSTVVIAVKWSGTIYWCGACSWAFHVQFSWWKCQNCIEGISMLVSRLEASQQTAHVGCNRHIVQNEKVLDAVYANPLTSTCWLAYKTGLNQSAVCRISYRAWVWVSSTQMLGESAIRCHEIFTTIHFNKIVIFFSLFCILTFLPWCS